MAHGVFTTGEKHEATPGEPMFIRIDGGTTCQDTFASSLKIVAIDAAGSPAMEKELTADSAAGATIQKPAFHDNQWKRDGTDSTRAGDEGDDTSSDEECKTMVRPTKKNSAHVRDGSALEGPPGLELLGPPGLQLPPGLSLPASKVSEKEAHSVQEVPAVVSVQRTTATVTGIAQNTTRQMLLKLLDEAGFANCYDLVYLPVDIRTRKCMGCALVNCITSNDAARLFYHFSRPTSGFDVEWGEVQGLKAYSEQYRNSPVMHPRVPDIFKPIMLVNGTRAPFPKPTRKIDAPTGFQG